MEYFHLPKTSCLGIRVQKAIFKAFLYIGKNGLEGFLSKSWVILKNLLLGPSLSQ